jgi:hypothetical protein
VYQTIKIDNVKVLAKRETGVLCERGGRTFEIPLEILWDEGEELVVGSTCAIEVAKSWARTNGLGDA